MKFKHLKQNSIKTALSLVICFCCLSCTAVNVRSVNKSQYPLKLVCIQRNPKVRIADFLQIVEERIAYHGIKVQIFDDPPDRCEYLLTYTALRQWDPIRTYLRYAEVRIEKEGATVGSATYRHRGGFAYFTKWRGTKHKMDPVIDQLLEHFIGSDGPIMSE